MALLLAISISDRIARVAVRRKWDDRDELLLPRWIGIGYDTWGTEVAADGRRAARPIRGESARGNNLLLSSCLSPKVVLQYGVREWWKWRPQTRVCVWMGTSSIGVVD